MRASTQARKQAKHFLSALRPRPSPPLTTTGMNKTNTSNDIAPVDERHTDKDRHKPKEIDTQKRDEVCCVSDSILIGPRIFYPHSCVYVYLYCIFFRNNLL